MEFPQLPDDLVLRVTEQMRPRDLLRFMLASTRMRRLGKQSRLWSVLRENSGLPAPKTSALKYKTDFDLITLKGCALCFRYPRDAWGFCRHCKAGNCVVKTQYLNLQRGHHHLRGLHCQRANLARKLAVNALAVNAMNSNMAVLGDRMAGLKNQVVQIEFWSDLD